MNLRNTIERLIKTLTVNLVLALKPIPSTGCFFIEDSSEILQFDYFWSEACPFSP